MLQLSQIVRTLLFINIAMLAIPSLMGTHEVMVQLLALRNFNAPAFNPYQLVTHMFMHDGISHLFFNMMGLVFFGTMLEQFWGAQRFLIFYMVCGVGAGLLYLGINYFETSGQERAAVEYKMAPNPEGYVRYLSDYAPDRLRMDVEFNDFYARNPKSEELITATSAVVDKLYFSRLATPMIGASGAIFGILMAFALLFPNTELYVFLIPFPIKAKYLVAFYGLTALFGALHKTAGDNVAHYAHLGGMLFGWVMVLVYKKDRNRFF